MKKYGEFRVELEDIKPFRFYYKDCENIIKDIKEWAKGKTHLMWIEKSILLKCDNVEDLFDNLRYEVKYYDASDSYRITDFFGEKLGEDKEIFEILSKYLEDGFIEFLGEDGDKLTLRIEKHKLIEERL